MALSKISQNNQTNATWRSRVDAGIDLLNSDILQANTSITITQTASNESTTQCVVTGHTSATFNASNYSNNAQATIQAAIDSLPKNMGGHSINIYFGTTSGQTISISAKIIIGNFTGGSISLSSAKTADNDSDSSTKANKIQSAGSTIDRIFEITKCSECLVQGLELIQNTGSTGDDSQFVIVSSSSWVDINHCVIKCGGVNADKYMGVLIQRGSKGFIRDCHIGNAYTAVIAANNGSVSVANTQHIATQPVVGLKASNGIILTVGTAVISGSVANELASNGGVVTPTNGVLLSQVATNTSNITSNDTDIASNLTKINADLLQASTTISVYAVNDARVTGHHTINYTSSNALQDAINALPKNMSGHSLTIQFQNGTYDFGTTQIYVIGFTGGVVTILGNQSDSGSGTYNVILQGQNTAGNGIISCKQCQDVIIKHLEFQHTGSGQSNYLLKSQVSNTVVYRCKFTRTATGNDNSRGVQIFDNCNARISECNFSSLNYAIYAQQNSSVSVVECHDYGTKPVNGVFAVTGAIVKPMYTDIHSSASNYGTSSGGLITHKSGVILEDTILRSDKTIDIPAGSSRAAVQAIINEQPQDLNGHNLIFRFASGTTSSPEVYDFGADDLQFKGFHGGVLTIRGVADESSTATGTAYKTKLRSTKASWEGLLNIDDCRRVNVISLQLDMYGTGTGQVGVRTQDSSVGVYDCRFTYSGTGTPNFTDLYVVGFDPLHSNGEISGCQFDKMSICVLGERSSHYFADNNVSFGTTPLRGYQATRGGIICPDGTVPNANTIYVTAEGGLITNKNGLILDETVLTGDKTVNFDSSMSVSDMQGLIDDQPKNLNGHTLTFKFADGTYNFGTSGLNFIDFSSGEVFIKGDTQTINADGSGLDVTINCSRGGQLGAIYVSQTTKAYIQFIKFVQNGSNTDTNMLRIIEATNAAVQVCSFQNTGTQGNDAIHCDNCRAAVKDCKFDNFARNIMGFDNSTVFSNNTATYSGGTDASQANLYAAEGTIITQTINQAGGGNVKQSNSGGVIFDKDGALV